MARPPGRVGFLSQAGTVVCGLLLALCAVQSRAANLPLDKASEPVRKAWQQCFIDHTAAQDCIDDLYARVSEFLPDNDDPENPSAASLNWGEYQYLLALLQRAVQQQDPMGDTVGALLGWKRHAENATYAFQEEWESLAALWGMVLYIEGQLAFLYGPEGDQTREQSVQAYLQLQDSVQDQAPALLEYFAVILARAHPQIDPTGQGKPPQSRDYYQQAEAYAVAAEAWERVVDYRLILNAMDSSEDRQDAIADFALEKGLRTQAVAVLLQASRITEMGVQNFDSPEIQRAQQRLTRACELARSDLEHFLCAFFRGQMAVRLGNLQTASQLVMALDEQAQVLADPAWLQYLNVNELATTLSRIAYESGDDADAASLMRQLVETLLGIGQPVSALGNEIYNLALFTLRAGDDPMALDVVQNYLHQERVTEGNRDDFYHLAAAYAWEAGDLETAIEKLEMISADRYL
ncbi:hypothetical protein, partial [Alcanivorax sp.]|uniref:hypothetical protein n=1 Tax=Alcanivorax sp. TaxID=1872427 RepID=UPI002585EE33